MCDLVQLAAGVHQQLLGFLAKTQNSSDRKPHPHREPLRYDWVLRELVLLVQQYSGGVSEAITLTSLLESWSSQAGRPSASVAGTGLKTLSQLLSNADGQADVEVQIADIEGRPAWEQADAAAAAPPLLLLKDPSKEEAVGMYLHTSFFSFCFGPQPVLKAGSQVRIGGCQVRRAPKATGLPVRLLPSAQLVLVLASRAEAAAAFQPLQIYNLAEVLAVEVGREERKFVECVVGCTVLRVAAADNPAHLLSTRTGKCCSVWLDGGGLEVELRLLDDQVQLRGLLRPGEDLLIKHPLLTTALGSANAVCVELSRETLLCLQDQSRSIEARLSLAAGGTSKQLYTCRPGHLLLLTGVYVLPREASAPPAGKASSTGIPMLTWQEGSPGVHAVNLSCLLGILMSPIFHTAIVPLPAVASAQASLAVVLCRLTVTAMPRVMVKRVHATCGRSLQRASLGFGDMFDEELPPASPQQQGAPSPGVYRHDDGGLWMCSFCGLDCSSAGTQASFETTLAVRDTTANGPETAVVVAVRRLPSACKQEADPTALMDMPG
ncbi:hypothetical protein WJX72_000890 [[Myrmecia] bisecta]|uniref:Uncharacterized protein n=1 Tax=[Myrmecia] bisecta TaxID=41462 RepID=A0AAW1P2L9_9CHLO